MAETELIEYIEIVLKRKRVVFFIFLLAIIITGLVSYLNLKAARETVTTVSVIEIGTVGNRAIENPIQLVRKINNQNFDSLIKKRLNLDTSFSLDIKASSLIHTNLVKLERTSKNPEQDKKILETLDKIILEGHQKELNTQKEILEKEIERGEKEIVSIKNEISSLEKQKEKIKKEIEAISNDPEKVVLLNVKIHFLNTVFSGISQQEQRLHTISEYVARKKLELQNYQPSKVVKEPSISKEEKFGLKNFLINIIVGGLVGGLVGVFLVFILDFWEKNKGRLREI